MWCCCWYWWWTTGGTIGACDCGDVAPPDVVGGGEGGALVGEQGGRTCQELLLARGHDCQKLWNTMFRKLYYHVNLHLLYLVAESTERKRSREGRGGRGGEAEAAEEEVGTEMGSNGATVLPVEIDGSIMEGGGQVLIPLLSPHSSLLSPNSSLFSPSPLLQILRMSVSLSALLGTPVRIQGIR